MSRLWLLGLVAVAGALLTACGANHSSQADAFRGGVVIGSGPDGDPALVHVTPAVGKPLWAWPASVGADYRHSLAGTRTGSATKGCTQTVAVLGDASLALSWAKGDRHAVSKCPRVRGQEFQPTWSGVGRLVNGTLPVASVALETGMVSTTDVTCFVHADTARRVVIVTKPCHEVEALAWSSGAVIAGTPEATEMVARQRGWQG